MSRRFARVWSAARTLVLVWAFVLGPALGSTAAALELRPWRRKPAPEPRFYPVYVIPHDAHARAFGYAVPTYNWGYFGASRGATCAWNYHTGYYNDYYQWSWRPRY